MTITAVIAEYNPFHRGHAFHLTQSRKLTGADYLIVVMSGNYVQRGTPAMFDKYTRAEAALSNGADLVLELPVCAATGSAEYFASGAVSLLTQTGIVTDLCFGSECADLSALKHLSEILSEEPKAYRQLLRQHLKTGHPYPRARALAVSQYDPALPAELLEEPNNLLGIEYLKALNKSRSSIRVHTIRRTGAAYHDRQLQPATGPASAGSLRAAFLENGGRLISPIREQLPSCELYKSYEEKPPITEDAFSLLLLERLRRNPGESWSGFFDVPEELSNRIRRCLDDFSSFSQFTDLLKTRNMTRTAVSRGLLHILLDIRTFHAPDRFQVLGFRREASVLLRELSVHGSLPLLVNPEPADDLESDSYGDRLYESVRSLLHRQPYQNEYRRKMLVVS